MKYIKCGFCGAFLLIIFFFFLATINNDKSISELEKRTLQTFPSFSTETLMDGSYMEELTTAFSDQLEMRDLLVKGYFIFQFQRYNGDVVKGKNDELYAACQNMASMPDERKKVKSIVTEINKTAEDIDAEFIFLSIPRKDAVETENLPDSYVSSREVYEESIQVVRENISDKVTLIDAYEIFQEDAHKNRYYYMTDHHITPRAAELLYLEIMEQVGGSAPIYDLSNYQVGETIINGSFNNQIGQSVKAVPEELYVLPKFSLDYERYEDEVESKLSIWAEANTYENAYMEGDQAYTVVDTGREELPNILYVGSSFTNILEALSVPSFNKMVSIDYRDNKSGNPISYYVDKHNIDYVIYIPSQSTNAFTYTMCMTHLGQ